MKKTNFDRLAKEAILLTIETIRNKIENEECDAGALGSITGTSSYKGNLILTYCECIDKLVTAYKKIK